MPKLYWNQISMEEKHTYFGIITYLLQPKIVVISLILSYFGKYSSCILAYYPPFFQMIFF